MTFWMKVCKFRVDVYLRKLNRVYSQILWMNDKFDELNSENLIVKDYDLTSSKEIINMANKVMSYIELVGEKYEQLPKCKYKDIMRDCYCISCNSFDDMIELFKKSYKSTSIKEIFNVQFKKYKDYLNER